MSAPRFVRRDETIAAAGEVEPGRGTHVRDGQVLALYDGELRITDGEATVVRERKPLPRRRLRRGEAAASEEGPASGDKSRRGADFRHGVGKHGRPVGKKKKGFGDQGAWD